jgi:predicted CXXCH cytochrome family protein
VRTRPIRMVAIACLTLAFFALPGIALAWDETGNTSGSQSAEYCGKCHDPYSGFNFSQAGVHGNYTTTTSKCEECHTVHKAPASGVLLLPAATIKATCFTCHDGTQGEGVYGALAQRGIAVGAQHGVETTTMVPGGDANTGGSTIETFRGPGETLTCTDCHSAHGSQVVTAFQGDRIRQGAGWSPLVTTKLLRQRPGESAVTVGEYGSDWCLGCHRGRSAALSAVHNHPAESIDTYADATTRFNYSRIARLASESATSITTTGTLGEGNVGYLMPFPRTPQQAGHDPICQPRGRAQRRPACRRRQHR